MDWDIAPKFGMQIDYGLPEQISSLKLNLEVVLRLYGRHIVKSIWRHDSAADRAITMKFGKQMQHIMSITILSSKLKQETEFQFGGRLFSETGSSFYLSRGLRYLVEIWLAHTLPPSETDTVVRPLPGSRFPTLWPPYCKIDMMP